VGRKRIAELFADHEHLVGLKVWDNLACTSGKVVAVAIEQHRPVITVRFPKTGPTKLLVVGHRPLKQKAYETIRLAPGEDYGRYRWLDRDAALEPPPSSAVFRVTIEAQTWRSAASKRQQAMATKVAQAIAKAVDDTLCPEPEGDEQRLSVEAAAERRGDSEYFDLVITVSVHSADDRECREMFERLASLLEVAASHEPGNVLEHWPTYYLGPYAHDLQQILTSRFTLNGSSGEEPLRIVEGSLRLR
jgi:hypothetical protein